MEEVGRLGLNPFFAGRRGPLVLAILDGVGIGAGDEADAVALARTPVVDDLKKRGLFRSLRAHGIAVGMPSDDDMGNSEVGHNAIGAGRIFAQGALRVNDAIADGSIFRSETWRWLIAPCAREGHALHLIGLLSDGNVHSHIDHLFALLRQADREGVRQVCVHILLDGRDVPQTSALLYIGRLDAVLAEINGGGDRQYQIASGGGRMLVTMDRYGASWEVVRRGWDAHVRGTGRMFPSATEAVETYRREWPGAIDQNLPEFVVARGEAPVGRMESGDAVIFFNFRGDRALELTQAFEREAFDHFDRGPRPAVRYAGMMQYDGDLLLPTRYLVPPPAIDRTMGEYLARTGVSQLAISETQKYGHVTYFWNGNRSGMFDPATETYIEVPSDRAPFEERPWMKAAEITDAVVARIQRGGDRFIRLNYANGDMVGHTGVREATIAAVAAVDLCVGRLQAAVEAAGGILVVTADHGNADEMYMRAKSGAIERDEAGRPLPKTSHTLSPVPFIVYDPQNAGDYELARGLETAGLANVAATVLGLLGYAPPPGYLPGLVRFRGEA
ncbi:MAG: 2,3-bisphosphoglycerate-independent phosphoglycerate mutase [Candidatus Schekmanbacteria bacterium]|nr:2,3-bisphosphoglycerate-independent phosphoglycerate mutase [Candidatus Schekmanbacteria bacterium]